MKKIIALLLAICTLASFMAILSSCKDKEDAEGVETSSQSESTTESGEEIIPASTTVTEEQWTAALNSLSSGNFTAIMQDESHEAAVVVTDTLIFEGMKQNGKIVTAEYRTNENGVTMVYECINDVWYKHPYVMDSWDNGVYGGHTRTWEQEYYWCTEGIIDDVLPIELLDYNDFTYDEEKGAYFCETIEINYGYGSDYLKNFYAYFVDGELFEVNYDFHDNDVYSAPIYHIIFSRDKAYRDISLPNEADVTPLPYKYSKPEDNKYVIHTEFDWQNALVSLQLGGYIYFEKEYTRFTMIDNKIHNFSEFGESYYSYENGAVYHYGYDIGENKWVKDAIEEYDNATGAKEIWDSIVFEHLALYTGYSSNLIFEELYWAYDYLEFNAETNEYVIDEYQSDRNGNEFRNIRVKTECGKAVEISFEIPERYEGSENTIVWHKVKITSASTNNFSLPTVE